MTIEFYDDLSELAKKHNVAIMCGRGENLAKHTKVLQGNMFFVTTGEKVLSIQGEESAQEASTTILLHKNRRKD